MRHLLLLTSLALSILLYSCAASLNTFSEYDKNTDLKNYKTYAWLPSTDSSLNKLMMMNFGNLIINSSNEELTKKGMIPDLKNPDAVFRFNLGVEQKVKYSQSPTLSVGVGIGGPFYYGGVAVPVAGGNITASKVNEAFLYITMFDTHSGNVLWTGGARKSVNNSTDSQKDVRLAVKAIFARLPIRHKSK